jgi:hypothetical protein
MNFNEESAAVATTKNWDNRSRYPWEVGKLIEASSQVLPRL